LFDYHMMRVCQRQRRHSLPCLIAGDIKILI